MKAVKEFIGILAAGLVLGAGSIQVGIMTPFGALLGLAALTAFGAASQVVT